MSGFITEIYFSLDRYVSTEPWRSILGNKMAIYTRKQNGDLY